MRSRRPRRNGRLWRHPPSCAGRARLIFFVVFSRASLQTRHAARRTRDCSPSTHPPDFEPQGTGDLRHLRGRGRGSNLGSTLLRHFANVCHALAPSSSAHEREHRSGMSSYSVHGRAKQEHRSCFASTVCTLTGHGQISIPGTRRKPACLLRAARMLDPFCTLLTYTDRGHARTPQISSMLTCSTE